MQYKSETFEGIEATENQRALLWTMIQMKAVEGGIYRSIPEITDAMVEKIKQFPEGTVKSLTGSTTNIRERVRSYVKSLLKKELLTATAVGGAFAVTDCVLIGNKYQPERDWREGMTARRIKAFDDWANEMISKITSLDMKITNSLSDAEIRDKICLMWIDGGKGMNQNKIWAQLRSEESDGQG